MRWVTFFSQTGTEILNLSKELNIVPDIIITNNSIENINTEYKNKKLFERLVFVSKKPSSSDYNNLLKINDTVTLHGWLRIVPEDICNTYSIYNLHPAPLTTYPFLKGKDPQKRTIELDLEYGGSTIHKCSPVLDSGEILLENLVDLKNRNNDEKNKLIYKSSFELWKAFLKARFC
jgi:folate-dependent phosphoribosylglycinamide formyltransferase PurN